MQLSLPSFHMVRQRFVYLAPLASALVALSIVLTGCAGGGSEDSQALQDLMKDHITKVDHRPVDSVTCTPHVNLLAYGEMAKLRCVVHFHDGSSYTANATIKNRDTGGAHNLPNDYSWDAPPPRSGGPPASTEVPTIDVAAAEKFVRGSFNPPPPTTVVCPSGVPNQPGMTFDCQVAFSDGSSGTVTVHIGDHKITLSPSDIRVTNPSSPASS